MKTMIKRASVSSAFGFCLTLGVTAASEPVETLLPAAVIPIYAILVILCALTGCSAAFLLIKIINPLASTPVVPVEIPESEEQTSSKGKAMIEEQAPPENTSPVSREEYSKEPGGGDEVFDYPDFS